MFEHLLSEILRIGLYTEDPISPCEKVRRKEFNAIQSNMQLLFSNRVYRFSISKMIFLIQTCSSSSSF